MRREAVYDVFDTTSKHQLGESPHKFFLMFVYLEDSLWSPHKFKLQCCKSQKGNVKIQITLLIGRERKSSLSTRKNRKVKYLKQLRISEQDWHIFI